MSPSLFIRSRKVLWVTAPKWGKNSCLRGAVWERKTGRQAGPRFLPALTPRRFSSHHVLLVRATSRLAAYEAHRITTESLCQVWRRLCFCEEGFRTKSVYSSRHRVHEAAARGAEPSTLCHVCSSAFIFQTFPTAGLVFACVTSALRFRVESTRVDCGHSTQ